MPESTCSLKPCRLVHLQLYPHHIPGSEGSHGLSTLSPPCRQLITSLRICSHHTARDRLRGCSLSKSPLFLSCFGASTNHHPLQYTFPRLKALSVILALLLFISYQRVHHATRLVLNSTAGRLFIICVKEGMSLLKILSWGFNCFFQKLQRKQWQIHQQAGSSHVPKNHLCTGIMHIGRKHMAALNTKLFNSSLKQTAFPTLSCGPSPSSSPTALRGLPPQNHTHNTASQLSSTPFLPHTFQDHFFPTAHLANH